MALLALLENLKGLTHTCERVFQKCTVIQSIGERSKNNTHIGSRPCPLMRKALASPYREN